MFMDYSYKDEDHECLSMYSNGLHLPLMKENLINKAKKKRFSELIRQFLLYGYWCSSSFILKVR